MSFYQKVYELCKLVPKGKITTYKLLAEKLGTKSYRAVGQALKRNPYQTVPCHRVIRSDGSLGGFQGKTDSTRKKLLLENEGIKIEKNRVKYL